MKKILLLILITLFSFSLLSCDKNNDSKTDDNEQTTNVENKTEQDGTTEEGKTESNPTDVPTEGKTESSPNDGNGDTPVVEELSSITYLKSLFGENIDIYTNSERNPYGVDLSKYGNNVNVYFYEPDFANNPDPYINVNKTEFYAEYKPATTYEDAIYRTKHYLMSGDITDQKHLPVDGKLMEEDKAIKYTDATYVLDADGKYLAYVPNVIDGDNYIIFYGAAYTSLNEVASYLLAFGTVPANQIANKKATGISQAISLWGKYGRVNNGKFSGNPSKYPFQPILPNIYDIDYKEMDFGTIGGYINSNSNGTYYNQKIYNDGNKINRGAARFVYVSDTSIKNINERYVFYTYNHYNDFQEYLNYHNGWGVRFGNQTAGNEYCGDSDDFYALNCISPTPYVETLLKKYSDK